MPRSSISPSLRPVFRSLAIAVAIIFVGAGAGVATMWFGLSGLTDALTQVVVPGTHTVRLSETGTYTLFYEHVSTLDGRPYITGREVPQLSVGLRDAQTGAPVTLETNDGRSTFSLPGRSGSSVLDFRITEPGDYVLTVSRPSDLVEPQVVLSYGKGFNAKLFLTVLLFIAEVFTSMGLAGAFMVVALVKYLRHRRQDGGQMVAEAVTP